MFCVLLGLAAQWIFCHACVPWAKVCRWGRHSWSTAARLLDGASRVHSTHTYCMWQPGLHVFCLYCCEYQYNLWSGLNWLYMDRYVWVFRLEIFEILFLHVCVWLHVLGQGTAIYSGTFSIELIILNNLQSESFPSCLSYTPARSWVSWYPIHCLTIGRRWFLGGQALYFWKTSSDDLDRNRYIKAAKL